MSAKLLKVLYVEENPDLEKHIGCMTGMFQMFNRHRLMGRRLTGISHKRLPSSGHPLSTGSNQREECSLSSPQIISECNPRKSSNENRKASTETSKAYLSSSLSFPSSLERSKTSESRSSDVDAKSVHSDLRDIVKDSINGQTRCLSVKTSSKEEVKKDRKLKHRDSPRPILIQDLNASSLQVMGRFKESARFSCDGREITRTKSTKVREMPRLSLDSRDSLRNSNFDPRLKELDKSPNQRVPSLVAKLMGLEAMPSSTSTDKGSEKNQIFGSDRNSKTPILKRSGETESVYSQIERSVKDLDFQESNKDLRALKHVLDTMEAKKVLSQKKKLSPSSANVQTPHVTTPRALGSPIVIMKPSKSVNRVEELEGLSGLRKLRTSGSSSRKQVKDSPSEKRTEDITPRPRHSPRETSVSQVMTSRSPRAQQRKIEVEKKPKPVVDPILPRIKNKVKANQAQKKSQQDKESDIINVCLVTGVDAAATRTDSCSMKLDSNQFQQGKQKSLWIVNEEVSTMEPALVSSEQPSPISVLDALFYHEEELSPSPVKRISTKPQDDDIPKSSEMDSSKVVGNIKNLVQKLRQMSSNQEPVLDYVSEALSSEKNSPTKSDTEKLHQKLILDVVQEILFQKLDSISHGPQSSLFVRARKLGSCSEIESLLVERPGSGILVNKEAISENDFCVEVPGLVLEIERLIFKDLVDDIVSGEAENSLLGKTTNRRLF